MCGSKFYVCSHCGNLIGMVNNAGVPMICCGEPMTLLEPNTVEASTEKHLPVVTREEGKVKVAIGDVPHPMIPEHFIGFVYLQTERGGQRKCLKAGEAPEVTFAVTEDEKPLAVFAWCNLHGLWKTEL
ncbi:MAG: desulfoferrodoxin [Clostridia bacterium]|nr:desulfoferrodoxin [Clostridia bacterium]